MHTPKTLLHRAARTAALAAVVARSLAACRPSDVLSVPPPAGVSPASAYQTQSGGEGLLAQGRAQVFQGLMQGGSLGLLQWSSLLSDEFTWSNFSISASSANVDARVTVGAGGFPESGDAPLQQLLAARLTLVTAVPVLKRFEPASGRSLVGEAYALIGYVELTLGEAYCAGVPLGQYAAAGDLEFGAPLSTDSILARAETDLDSATAYAGDSASIASLAGVGLARARLDRGDFAGATAAAATVPTAFVYNAELEPGGVSSGAPYTFNLYDYQAHYTLCGFMNVADKEGANGLNFVSAGDPRLVLSTAVAETCDGESDWQYPVKFGDPSTFIPLATGVEARLIDAEAALRTPDVTTWAEDLNALRGDSADTHVHFDAVLPADSTTAASVTEQVDVMFRERAFWLFGTGTRLGDMRRLIRQYGRDQSTVFPTGPYPNGANANLPTPLPNYGADVSLTLPTAAGGLSDPNPAYKGCITSTRTA